MFQAISSFISDFFSNIRFVDLLDILFVTVFLYIFIHWFRKSASRRLIIAAVAFISVYLIARILGLFLTEMLINIIAVFIALAFIIIFQSDIRRLVDIVGTWSLRRWKLRNQPLNQKVVDLLAEACVKMAERRTGAIIAIKGGEPWDQAITGGVPLNGAVSLPLIYSIFSTSSPGHDGAVLIEDGIITKFGAHLPLSKNLAEIGTAGTRHAASLGLSELCDALVIVVSEERGSIKLAVDGKFQSIDSAAKLKEKLDEFCQKHYTNHKEPLTEFWKSGKAYTGLLSFALAVVLWAIFAYQSKRIMKKGGISSAPKKRDS